MYYQNYEDYMRSILGYPMPQQMNAQSTYPQEDIYYYDSTIMQTNQSNQELEKLYPETYKIIYPMICKICDENRHKQLTAQLLDEMTKEIYKNVEVDEHFNTKLEVNTPTKSTIQNNRQENRQTTNRRPNNYLLNDLIRILILRNLIGNPNRPPRFPRPPFPGGPGFPPSYRPGYFN